LRERREDIPLLVDHFVARFNRLQDKHVQGLADEALACLMHHDWPGNVRELENVIERAFVLCRSGLIETRHLPPELREQLAEAEADAAPGSPAASALRQVEGRMILRALARHGGNRTAAARDLGIHPSTLFRKAKALGLDLPPRDGRHRRGD
ncbi:MAG: helix-turn-helix domain-containing protein, partial [Phycisphaeraceae bacterium]